MFIFLQLEDNNDFLHIYDGGSDNAEIVVANLTGTINETKIVSIPGNQIFVVFTTNKEIVGKGFNALIIESKNCKKMRKYQKINFGYFQFINSIVISI